MRGLDDGEPEEHDGVRVSEWDKAMPVGARVRGWTAGERTRDEERAKREGRRERERERERGA